MPSSDSDCPIWFQIILVPLIVKRYSTIWFKRRGWRNNCANSTNKQLPRRPWWSAQYHCSRISWWFKTNSQPPNSNHYNLIKNAAMRNRMNTDTFANPFCLHLWKQASPIACSTFKMETAPMMSVGAIHLRSEMKIPTIREPFKSPLIWFLTFALNDCGYCRTTKILLLNGFVLC